LFYLAGAIVMSVVMGVIVILALHAGHLNHPHQRTPGMACGLVSASWLLLAAL
jgi:hypothetical protein